MLFVDTVAIDHAKIDMSPYEHCYLTTTAIVTVCNQRSDYFIFMSYIRCHRYTYYDWYYIGLNKTYTNTWLATFPCGEPSCPLHRHSFLHLD